MRRLLSVSLVLNFGLVLVVGYCLKKSSAPVASAPDTGVTALPAAKTTGVAPRNSPATPHTDAPLKASFNWREVESPEYKVYIAKLRAVHCPEATIADIIIADVSKYYRNKLAPFRKDTDNTVKFWLNNQGFNRRDPAYDKMWRETEKEKNTLLKELLGKNYREQVAIASGWDTESKDPFFQGLSKEKKDQMAEITEKFNERKNEIYQRSRNGQDEEDRQELTKIAEEQTAALAKVFTPEELFEYQVRTSEAAQNMRWNELEGFDPSEEEFRAIVKTKLPPTGENLSATERAALVKEANDNLKATMGEERYKEYTLNQNWEYRTLKNIVDKYGGDKEIARQIYGLKSDLQRAVDTVRNDRSLTRDEREKKLQAIQAETEKTLTVALSERGYKALKRSAPWIQNIAR